MSDTKRWYQSKSVWGWGLTVLLAVAEAFSITPEALPAEWGIVIGAVAGLVARLVARHRLTT